MIKEIHKVKAADFIMSRHYSPVMPRLTKYYCGYYVDNTLQGVITFGWGTRPKHTIQKLFPKLDTKVQAGWLTCRFCRIRNYDNLADFGRKLTYGF